MVQALAAVCLGAVAVVCTILFVAGAHNNAQIDELRSHGARVEVRVSSCLGLLGGSGSNAAGYSCQGAYTYGGRHFEEAIPGNVERTPGTTLVGLIAPGDPELLSTPSQLRSEHSSWRVFIAPSVLALVLLVALGALALRRRASRPARS